MRHRRQRAQTLVIAVVGMVAMLGAVSLVIDAGMYFVLKRQLQNAADAAALAAVWYEPACNSAAIVDPEGHTWGDYGCQPDNQPTAAECDAEANKTYDSRPCTAAVDAVRANWGEANTLCNGPNVQYRAEPVEIRAYPGTTPPDALTLFVPAVTPYVVSLSCNAPHWFGHVLPGVNLTMPISASATAALGWLGPNGQLLGAPVLPLTPTSRLVARLIL